MNSVHECIWITRELKLWDDIIKTRHDAHDIGVALIQPVFFLRRSALIVRESILTQ